MLDHQPFAHKGGSGTTLTEKIAAALKVSKGVVAKYVGLASAAGLDWETVKDWDGRQLVARLLP
jgi:hypothetical protein